MRWYAGAWKGEELVEVVQPFPEKTGQLQRFGELSFADFRTEMVCNLKKERKNSYAFPVGADLSANRLGAFFDQISLGIPPSPYL